jgi:hypothetical protein
VALFAGSRAFFAFSVAAFAGLVSEVFAETFDFAGTFFVAFFAVTNSSLVGFVVELYTFFEFHDIGGTDSSSKGNNS